jgi:hypothetical protein
VIESTTVFFVMSFVHSLATFETFVTKRTAATHDDAFAATTTTSM